METTTIKESGLTRARTLMNEVKELVQELTESRLIVAGHEYKLSEWVTLADYARKNDLQLARVQRWVDRGIIEKENVLIVPELNNLKLIKNQPYATRAMK